jgi:hypothetical protein
MRWLIHGLGERWLGGGLGRDVMVFYAFFA